MRCDAKLCVRLRRGDSGGWCFQEALVAIVAEAEPCRGRPRGFLVQVRQPLLLKLHPGSIVPLGAEMVHDSGQALPTGSFTKEVQEAESSGTTTVDMHQHNRPGSRPKGQGGACAAELPASSHVPEKTTAAGESRLQTPG